METEKEGKGEERIRREGDGEGEGEKSIDRGRRVNGGEGDDFTDSNAKFTDSKYVIYRRF